MKKLALVFAMLSLASTARADVLKLRHEMQTFLVCYLAPVIADSGVEIELRQARVGGYKEAWFRRPCLFGVLQKPRRSAAARWVRF